jgi:hypothetical protein
MQPAAISPRLSHLRPAVIRNQSGKKINFLDMAAPKPFNPLLKTPEDDRTTGPIDFTQTEGLISVQIQQDGPKIKTDRSGQDRSHRDGLTPKGWSLEHS